MLGKRLNPIALGCVMSRSKVSHADFPSKISASLRNFPTNESVCTQISSLLNHVLRSAGTPSKSLDRSINRTHRKHWTFEASFHVLLQSISA